MVISKRKGRELFFTTLVASLAYYLKGERVGGNQVQHAIGEHVALWPAPGESPKRAMGLWEATTSPSGQGGEAHD